MKNLILICLLSLCFGCKTAKIQSGKSVGFVKNGSYIVSNDYKDSVVTNWNGLLKDNKLKTQISTLKIIRDSDYFQKNVFYGLLGNAANDSVKVIYPLKLLKDKFYFDKETYPATVICHGCKDCTPGMDDGQWVCNSETILECKKIVVVEIPDVEGN